MYTNIQKNTPEIWVLVQEAKRNLTGHYYLDLFLFTQTTKNYNPNTLKNSFGAILVLDSGLFHFRK